MYLSAGRSPVTPPRGVPLRPPGVPPSPCRVARHQFWSILVAPGLILRTFWRQFWVLFRYFSGSVLGMSFWSLFGALSGQNGAQKRALGPSLMCLKHSKYVCFAKIHTFCKNSVSNPIRKPPEAIFTSILGAFWVHFRLMLAPFSRPFSSRYFNTNFGAFGGGTPPLPGGSRRQGRGLVGKREYCIWVSGG